MKYSCLPYEFVNKQLKDPTIKKLYQTYETSNDDPLVLIDFVHAVNTYKLEITDPFKSLSGQALLKAMLDINISLAVRTWMEYKQIFTFEKEFWDLLTDKESDQSVNIDVIKQSPYKAFFIEPLNVFVYFELNGANYEIKSLQINDKAEFVSYDVIPLKEGLSLKESINLIYEEANKITKDKWDSEIVLDDERKNKQIQMATKIMTALIYLCSDQADVVEIKQKPKKDKAGKKVKQKYKGVKKAVVGEVITRSIRASKISAEIEHREKSSSGGGWTQRPHMRKAHWHSFWKGTGEEKKLIVKWIPPIYVHKDDGVMKITRNKVKR